MNQEDDLELEEIEKPPVKKSGDASLLNIESAALEAGYSLRHFRRVVEDEGIPIVVFGHKFFLKRTDLDGLIYGKTNFQEPSQRPEPPDVNELVASYLKNFDLLRDAVSQVFEVELRHRFLDGADSRMHQAVSIWAFLIMEIFSVSGRFAAIAMESSWPTVREMIADVAGQISTDLSLAEKVEEVRMIFIGDLSLRKDLVLSPRKLSNFRASNLNLERNREKKIILGAIRKILQRHKLVGQSSTNQPKKLNEKEMLMKVLEQSDSMAQACVRLGIKPQQLLVKCRDFGITNQLKQLLQKR